MSPLAYGSGFRTPDLRFSADRAAGIAAHDHSLSPLDNSDDQRHEQEHEQTLQPSHEADTEPHHRQHERDRRDHVALQQRHHNLSPPSLTPGREAVRGSVASSSKATPTGTRPTDQDDADARYHAEFDLNRPPGRTRIANAGLDLWLIWRLCGRGCPVLQEPLLGAAGSKYGHRPRGFRVRSEVPLASGYVKASALHLPRRRPLLRLTRGAAREARDHGGDGGRRAEH